MVTILLDPAHGGDTRRGKSTPRGFALSGDSPEKLTTWELAGRVRAQLGSDAETTRHGDENLSLAQRIAVARDESARVFISIHAHPAGAGFGGHEIWIHTRGSEDSLALAQAVSKELSRFSQNGRVHRGDLAVLVPDRHASMTAACMVEVEAEQGRDLGAVADAIANAVRGFLRGGVPTGLSIRRPSALSLVTPSYQPQNQQDAMRAFQQWQADANRFLLGVPPAAHAIFPHSAICRLHLQFSDGSAGDGTGFFVRDDLILTAAHCLYEVDTGAYVTSVDVFPGQANDTPRNSFTVSGAGVFRVHERYNGGTAFDLGLIRAPRGKYDWPFFKPEEQNMSYTPGSVIVCGYAARLTPTDLEVLKACATIDPIVQHLSCDTIQELIQNDEAFTYSLQTLAGTSGAPVFYASGDEAKCIGVHHGARDSNTNQGCRLTTAKINWIFGDWGSSSWPPAPTYGRRGAGQRAPRRPETPRNHGSARPPAAAHRPARPGGRVYGAAAPSASFPAPRGAHESYGSRAYGRAPAMALADPLDLTGFDRGQFSLVPETKADRVPNNLTPSELSTLEQAWSSMNKGSGLRLQGSAANINAFRAMILDCMATSKILREAFLRITGNASTVTLDLVRTGPGIFLDAFEHEASTGNSGRGLHTLDLDDMDQIPRVSTTTVHFKQTRSQKLIHALTEAGTGVTSAVADASLRYRAAHRSAIDQENRYRREQGMLGSRGYDQPLPVAGGYEYHLADGGRDFLVETWAVTANNNISGITYNTSP